VKKRQRDHVTYLSDMLAYTQKAQKFVAGVSLLDFAANDEKLFAVIYALEVIGEAANHLPRSFTRRYPDVPWAAIVGMRNLVIHGYDVVDAEIVWKTVEEDLPRLHIELERILADLGQISQLDKGI
jgi:uncharacterized protein with HEPN domain